MTPEAPAQIQAPRLHNLGFFDVALAQLRAGPSLPQLQHPVVVASLYGVREIRREWGALLRSESNCEWSHSFFSGPLVGRCRRFPVAFKKSRLAQLALQVLREMDWLHVIVTHLNFERLRVHVGTLHHLTMERLRFHTASIKRSPLPSLSPITTGMWPPPESGAPLQQTSRMQGCDGFGVRP